MLCFARGGENRDDRKFLFFGDQGDLGDQKMINIDEDMFSGVLSVE